MQTQPTNQTVNNVSHTSNDGKSNNYNKNKPPQGNKYTKNPKHANLECHYCLITGHVMRDCRKRKWAEHNKLSYRNNRMNNQRGSRYNPRFNHNNSKFNSNYWSRYNNNNRGDYHQRNNQMQNYQPRNQGYQPRNQGYNQNYNQGYNPGYKQSGSNGYNGNNQGYYNNPNNYNRDTRRCYKCGEENHISINCPRQNF